MSSTYESSSEKGAAQRPSHNAKRRRRNEDAPQYGNEVISVVVGEHKTQSKTFLVYKDILIKHAEFFKAALSKSWTEGIDKKVLLDYENPETFDVFVQFLYTGQLFTIKEGDFKLNDNGKHDDAEWSRLSECWALGERLLSSTFKDAITDAIIDKIVNTARHPTGIQRFIYNSSAGPNGMRKLLTDLVVWEWKDENLSVHGERERVPDFIFDVAVALHKIKKTGLQGKAPYKNEDTCTYHDHGVETPCYKTMF